MQIIIHDTNDLSALDLRVLGALLGTDTAAAPAAKASAPAAAPKAEKAAPKAAPKAAEPEADDAEDSGDGAEAGTDEPTMQDAVAMATKLVSNGKAAQVKAALAEVGAKRVSEIPEDKVSDFVASLS